MAPAAARKKIRSSGIVAAAWRSAGMWQAKCRNNHQNGGKKGASGENNHGGSISGIMARRRSASAAFGEKYQQQSAISAVA